MEKVDDTSKQCNFHRTGLHFFHGMLVISDGKKLTSTHTHTKKIVLLVFFNSYKALTDTYKFYTFFLTKVFSIEKGNCRKFNLFLTHSMHPDADWDLVLGVSILDASLRKISLVQTFKIEFNLSTAVHRPLWPRAKERL